jgi:hypothetical protein
MIILFVYALVILKRIAVSVNHLHESTFKEHGSLGRPGSSREAFPRGFPGGCGHEIWRELPLLLAIPLSLLGRERIGHANQSPIMAVRLKSIIILG